MKKALSLGVLSLLILGLTGCGPTIEVINSSEDNNGINVEDNSLPMPNPEIDDNIDEYGEDLTAPWVLTGVIAKNIEVNHRCGDNSTMFVNIAILGEKHLKDSNTEYYVVARGDGYYINSRGDLQNSCGFSIPMKFTISENQGNYDIVNYEEAKDGSDYGDSIKAMFSDEAAKKLSNGDYEFEDKRSTLEMAEDYFKVKIIPEEKQEFDCSFCDKLWYYEPLEDEDGKSNDLVFNYVSKDNGKNTIFFGSDGKFEAKGSWDEGKGTWVFGNNANTVIVSDSHADHIYTRYVITNQNEENLNTILEIIQRK